MLTIAELILWATSGGEPEIVTFAVLLSNQTMAHYTDDLNAPQREAVLHTEGPVMLIAGAGSGKTRVLTYRIAHLLDKGVEPYNILSLTFTNKAAAEMRKRIEKLVGPEARNIWMGTFHSVFAKILRFEAERLGYPSNFSIYDTDDVKSLLRSIIKELNLDDKIYKVNTVLNRISGAKNRLITPEGYAKDPFLREDDIVAQRPRMAEIYQIYKNRLFKAGAMDFDDLLFNTNVLFRDCPDVLNKYQQKFHYVMVDEYQDTNLSQYLITKLLAAVRENICVVGDDAQSIYAFRGADIQNILNFEKDYPDLKVIKLEQNYRSTGTIVQAANSVIAQNQNQLKKKVWTGNEDGTLIEVIRAASDNEEGKLVATTIFEEKMRENWQNRDFAILYRTNAQSRSIEEALRRSNIKYRIIGGMSFYQRKEIKDLVAYLRFIINPNDEESLKRIINTPKRGIGDGTVAKLFVIANDQGADLWDTIKAAKELLGTRVGGVVDEFTVKIQSFQVAAQHKDAFALASQVAKESGLMRELFEDKTPEGVSRYENVQELLNAIKEFVDNPEREDKSIGTFLQEISLITDADDKAKTDDDAVTLMTIHMAKGLEFKSVFIVGLEENLFPSQMMLASRADLEEERRLFYVAITRAEKRLRLGYALTRYRFGNLIQSEPSRFLNEIDPKYLMMTKRSLAESEVERAIGPPKKFMDQFNRNGGTVAPNPAKKIISTTHVTSENFVPSPVEAMSVGARVEHAKFGFGVIKHLDTGGPEKRATVQFELVGEKVMLLSFAKLMVV